jgi:hypothetical protein
LFATIVIPVKPSGSAGNVAGAERTQARLLWVACAVLSIALHLTLVFGTTAIALRPSGTGGEGKSMTVRLAPAPTDAEAAAELGVASVQFEAEPPRVEVAAMQPQPRQPVGSPAPSQRNEPDSGLPILPSALALPDAFDEAEYIPGADLSVRPSPAERISVPYPADVDRRGVTDVILTLFIDEVGTVVRVRGDSSDLPSRFREVAENAFSRARFHPGLVDGLPVRSRIRIAVTFDSGTADAGQREPRLAPISVAVTDAASVR